MNQALRAGFSRIRRESGATGLGSRYQLERVGPCPIAQRRPWRRSVLVEGQRLDQPAFHALYEAMPPGTRAELIDGVVYMPSPASAEHGEAQVAVIVWLDYYAENTPGVRAMDNGTTILGWKSEPQPDGSLRVLPEYGGRTSDRTWFRPWSARAGRRGRQGNPVRRPGAEAE